MRKKSVELRLWFDKIGNHFSSAPAESDSVIR